MDWLGDVGATWFLVAVFVACGAACVARALRLPAERAAWGPIGVGLLLYASGSTVYNLELSATHDLTFPSRADALWLMLVPFTLAGMIGLVRARQVHVNASLWLDGMIGGTVVAALAAVFALHPILATSVGENWASAAHLAYPLGDLLLMGFAVVLWGAGGWRIDAWFGLAAAFALIAMSDAIYVAAQLNGGWAPGSSNDLGYAAGSLLIAVAAWGSRRGGGEASPTARVALPIGFTVTAFLLVVYEAFTELDPVAVAMIRLTLLAVVVRLGLTLWWRWPAGHGRPRRGRTCR